MKKILFILFTTSLLQGATVKLPMAYNTFSSDYYAILKTSMSTPVAGSVFSIGSFSITRDGYDICLIGISNKIPYLIWLTTYTYIKNTLSCNNIFECGGKTWGIIDEASHYKYYPMKTSYTVNVVRYNDFNTIIENNKGMFIEISTTAWVSYRFFYGD